MSFIWWEYCYLSGEEFVSLWQFARTLGMFASPFYLNRFIFSTKRRNGLWKAWPAGSPSQPILWPGLCPTPLWPFSSEYSNMIELHWIKPSELTINPLNTPSALEAFPKNCEPKGEKLWISYKETSVPLSLLLNSCCCLLHLYKTWKPNTGNM